MKKPTEKAKMYIIRKYIMATNVSQAILKDKDTAIHDCYVDSEWQGKYLADAIGFHRIETEYEEE